MPRKYEKFVPRNWTKGAIACYKRGCCCINCFINNTYIDTLSYGRCYMKKCVLYLVKQYGVPNKMIERETIINDDEELLREQFYLTVAKIKNPR